MLSEPHFNVLTSADLVLVCAYRTQPLPIDTTNALRVRFDEIGALDAVVIPQEVYAVLTFAPTRDPIKLEHIFALLQMSGHQWCLVEPFAPTNSLAMRVKELVVEHAAVGRKHWKGGRQVFVQQCVMWVKRYVWHPTRWRLLYRSLKFEYTWLQRQRSKEFKSQLELIHLDGRCL